MQKLGIKYWKLDTFVDYFDKSIQQPHAESIS